MPDHDDRELLEDLGMPAWAIGDLERLGRSGGKSPVQLVREIMVGALDEQRSAREPVHETCPTLYDAWVTFERAQTSHELLRWTSGEQCSARHWMKRFWQTVGMDIPLRNITPLVIRAFLGGPGVKDWQAERTLTLLRSFFEWCIENGSLERSPIPADSAWQQRGAHHPVIGRRAFEEQREAEIQAAQSARAARKG